MRLGAMLPHSPHPRGQDGFTIIETLVASVLLLIGMAATLTLVDTASSTTATTHAREQGTNLQRELVEAARSVPYDQLTPNGVGATVRTRPALGDASGATAGWTIRRRGTTYTVSMGVCTVDDPRDGSGPHVGGVFCPPTPSPPPDCPALIKASALGTLPGAGAGADASAGLCGIDADLDGTVDGVASVNATVCLLAPCTDTNPADYKRIVSLVRWPGGYNLQTSQVNSPGQAAAPAVTSLTAATTLVDNTWPSTSLGLTAVATNSPKAVALYLDGTALQPGFSGSGANWTYSWGLGSVTGPGGQPSTNEVLDGSYQLSAKAFDVYGQYGATRSQTIVVNRRVAFAPAHVGAGRNGSAVEIEWSPPREHDSAGFRVDRRINYGLTQSAWVTACPVARQTSCRDASAPAAQLLRTVEYSVVGYDTNPGGQLREGDRSEVRGVDPAKSPPNRPGSLQAAASGGDVVLTWTAPTGLVAADHYNIYRDGQTYADRLDSVYLAPGQPLSYTDTRTTGVEHNYWITAVNDQLGESPQVGPVRK